MDRRESIKSLLVGSMAGGMLVSGCADPQSDQTVQLDTSSSLGDYGRTEQEKEHDQKLMKEKFFTSHELATIAVLCDIILPATGSDLSAVDVNVPEFVEFIVKDLPYHQQPLRGGIMWLDHQTNTKHNKVFKDCSSQQQLEIVDQIAYPNSSDPAMQPGVTFFNRIRNLTLTGYYTTEEGVRSLGYKGNTPNIWDGVPPEVLEKHGLSYDEEWLSKCIDQSTRNITAEWDDQGNLIT